MPSERQVRNGSPAGPVRLPSVEICPMCGEEVTVLQSAPDPLYTPEGPRMMHRVCALREVLGGIGHHLDHEHFCIDWKDPDAGLDYYTSALMVDVWVRRKGLPDAEVP